MSRPWRPPRCREHPQLWEPQYTYNTRGNMAMTGSSNSCRGAGPASNSCRGAGPAEVTEPPPHFQGGPGAASQVLAQVHIALVEGNSCRGAGPAEVTEPPPHFQGGPGAASQVLAQVHIALVEG